MNAVDLVALALLLVFVLWGAWRGPLRQGLLLMLLAGALCAGRVLAGSLADTATRVTGLQGPEAEAAAWVALVFGALVLGSLLLALAAPLVERVGTGGFASRIAGAILGGVLGSVVLVTGGYVMLTGRGDEPRPRPPLARDAPSMSDPADEASAGTKASWREAVRTARAAEGIQRGGAWLRQTGALPAWVTDRMEAVDRSMAPIPEDRP